MDPYDPADLSFDYYAALLVPRLPVLMPPPPRWMARAACADANVEMFYPGRGEMRALARARAICEDCPVRQPCLAWALEHDERGVWGGTTWRQRQAMQRQDAA